jgi:hypothetical protein
MMMLYPEYIPPILTNNYIEEKNIISLCLNKILKYKDIRDIISNFLLTFSTGLSKYDITKQYTINNIKYKFNHSLNHPIYCVLRLLSKYKITSNNNIEFNEILKNIDNIPNNKETELDICFNYLINKNKKILNYIVKPTSLSLILDFINDNICKLKLSLKFILYSYNYNNALNNNAYNKSICEPNIELDNKYITFEDLLINNLGKIINNNNNYYHKKIINTSNNIIYFELNRFEFNFTNNRLKESLNDSIILIPKILNLPPFICYKNKHIKLELISVILYHIDIKQYSIIIKDNNDYIHIFNNKFILIDNEYFYNIIAKYAIILFYKKINN